MTIEITMSTEVNAGQEKPWQLWTEPEHIVHWNFANDDWYCPSATNDLQPGGTFSWRMEAKDKSMGFDFQGTYTTVTPLEQIVYRLEDGRVVTTKFEESDTGTRITQTFEAEDANSAEQQKAGWSTILANFKGYVESARA